MKPPRRAERALPVAAALALVLLAGGCASPATGPANAGLARAEANKALIDGLAADRILPKTEYARIKRAIPAQNRDAVISAEALGRILYEHDRLATQAGDLLTSGGHADFPGTPLGWLTERTATGLRVVFIVRTQDGPQVAVQVEARGGSGKPRVRRFSPPRALSPEEAPLWSARELAFTAKIRPCAKRYNPVVVPVQNRGESTIYVFLLPASPKPDIVFLGGYYRIAVSGDGKKIVETHAFTHACVTLHRDPRAVSAGVTELKSGTPTTPQVYASLHYAIPVDIETAANRLLWKVDKGQISLLGPVDGQ